MHPVFPATGAAVWRPLEPTLADLSTFVPPPPPPPPRPIGAGPQPALWRPRPPPPAGAGSVPGAAAEAGAGAGPPPCGDVAALAQVTALSGRAQDLLERALGAATGAGGGAPEATTPLQQAAACAEAALEHLATAGPADDDVLEHQMWALCELKLEALAALADWRQAERFLGRIGADEQARGAPAHGRTLLARAGVRRRRGNVAGAARDAWAAAEVAAQGIRALDRAAPRGGGGAPLSPTQDGPAQRRFQQEVLWRGLRLQLALTQPRLDLGDEPTATIEADRQRADRLLRGIVPYAGPAAWGPRLFGEAVIALSGAADW